MATIIAEQAVTISIGVAQYRTAQYSNGEYETPESWTEWMKRADEHLYEAKRLGRNRVALTSGPHLVPDGSKQGSSKQDSRKQDVSSI